MDFTVNTPAHSFSLGKIRVSIIQVLYPFRCKTVPADTPAGPPPIITASTISLPPC